MNLSMKWILDYVNLKNIDVKEFSDVMTMTGSKVENWKKENDGISKVVVGKVLSISKHPNADKLVICSVDVGQKEPIQIVTGATNVVENALVPVCLNGGTLPGGVKIKSGNLRGIKSDGMMCSLGELGLTKNDFPYAIENGIFLIKEDCSVGDDVCSAIGLDDTVVEFEITSNRPDCFSVIGLAREAAASFNLPLNIKKPSSNGSLGKIHDELEVEIKSPLCSRYMAKMVKNVKIAPSPRWIRERLRASGVRPINNVVDITNFVMLEYGHPMHAFDARHIEGNKIIVRTAKSGEALTTLDAAYHKLSDDMLMICDSQKPVSVAGIMGGEHSGIEDDTKTIIFESACFDGASIRRTSKSLAIRSESSARFEKGLDPRCCDNPLERACELIELLGVGDVVGGVIDEVNFDEKDELIKLDSDWINNFLGINLSKQKMENILKSLGFKIDGDNITVPEYRVDIKHKADIAEEIARIYGYDNIKSSIIQGEANGGLFDYQHFKKMTDEVLLGLGCNEIYTYSFISPKEYDKINLTADDKRRDSIKIKNPLGEYTSIMRTTTLPSMLSILSKNYSNKNHNIRLYEISKVYISKEKNSLPDEPYILTIGMYDECDFYVLKGLLESVLYKMSIKGYDFSPAAKMPFHDYRCCEITKEGKLIGTFGEVHPTVCENYEIKSKVYLAELNFGLLYELADDDKVYCPLPKFPASSRDLSIVCNEELHAGKLKTAIEDGIGKILESAELFDVYRGDQIEKGKKSISYKISMRSKDHTLTDDEVDKAISRVLKNLDKLGAFIRD